jgi:hypothetical protein
VYFIQCTKEISIFFPFLHKPEEKKQQLCVLEPQQGWRRHGTEPTGLPQNNKGVDLQNDGRRSTMDREAPWGNDLREAL